MLVFGIEFAEMSLCDLVEPEEARIELKSAEQTHRLGDMRATADHIARAFYFVLQDYEGRKRVGLGYDSPFEIGEHSFRMDSFGLGLSVDRKHGDIGKVVGKLADQVQQTFKQIQEAVKILALGIDYRRYSRFRFTVGEAQPMLDSSLKVFHPWGDEDIPSAEEIKSCLDFVVETAIGLSSFDYTLQGDPGSRVRRVHPGRSPHGKSDPTGGETAGT